MTALEFTFRYWLFDDATKESNGNKLFLFLFVFC